MRNTLPVCTTEDSWYLQEKFLANIHYKGFSIEMRTKVPLKRSLRIQMYLFIGDMLIQASSRGVASRHKSAVISTLQDHSTIMNRKKINLTPAQIIAVLGVTVYSTSPLGGSACQNNGTWRHWILWQTSKQEEKEQKDHFSGMMVSVTRIATWVMLQMKVKQMLLLWSGSSQVFLQKVLQILEKLFKF